MVMHTLSSEFTLLRVVNGETVAAHNLGVTNGFVKPKLGKFGQACTLHVCFYFFSFLFSPQFIDLFNKQKKSDLKYFVA